MRTLSLTRPYTVGADVAKLQALLKITADGVFGPQTEAAVRAYQQKHGLQVDGVVGPQTWGALVGNHPDKHPPKPTPDKPPSGLQHISSAGLNLITEFEGYSGHPYRDSVGVWTIGYGHTEGVGPGTRSITQKQAMALLRVDLANKYEVYIQRMRLPLTQHQFDALVSFVYNLGGGYVLPGHTMGDALRAHNWKAAANAFLLYDHAGGQVLAGLTRRRRAERALFLS